MAERRKDREHWARVTEDWIAWARTPDHDVFWAYCAALQRFIGEGSGEALDLGCGEGRVSRLLQSLGYYVTAVDAVAGMVEAATEADSARHYCVADAACLPFADGRFKLVMAYNLLMSVDDVPAVLKEVRRVLTPDGQVILSLVHPFSDRGRFADTAPDAPFLLEGDYFGRASFEGVEERNGLRMTFSGWSQPLENYMDALESAGLAVTSLREPQPDDDPKWEGLKPWSRIPLFLWLKARPLA